MMGQEGFEPTVLEKASGLQPDTATRLLRLPQKEKDSFCYQLNLFHLNRFLNLSFYGAYQSRTGNSSLQS